MRPTAQNNNPTTSGGKEASACARSPGARPTSTDLDRWSESQCSTIVDPRSVSRGGHAPDSEPTFKVGGSSDRNGHSKKLAVELSAVHRRPPLPRQVAKA
jgi:hypothetical protein